MSDTVLVRIAPANNRLEHHCHGKKFEKSKGWYGPVPRAFGELLKKEMMSDNPEVPQVPVFEVKDAKAAAVVVAKEKTRVDPAGTPTAPVRVPGVTTTPTAPAAPPAPPQEDSSEETTEAGGDGEGEDDGEQTDAGDEPGGEESPVPVEGLDAATAGAPAAKGRRSRRQ